MNDDDVIQALFRQLHVDMPLKVGNESPIEVLLGDSLAAVEMWILFEEAGADLPVEAFSALRTIGDAVHFLQSRCDPTTLVRLLGSCTDI